MFGLPACAPDAPVHAAWNPVDARVAPLALGRRARPLLDVDADAFAQSSAALVQTGCDRARPSPSSFLHVLRLCGPDGAVRLQGRETALLAPFFDDALGRRVFGDSIASRTRYGARYRVRSDLFPTARGVPEWHLTQTLATCAELGVPLTRELRLEGGAVPLRAVLADTLAGFTIDAPEPEWTALALIHYLPPHTGWTNRFGQRYAFDDLAELLLAQSPTLRPCAGVHVYQTLILMLRAHALHPILKAPVHDAVQSRVRRWTEHALANQRVDGSFGRGWWRGPAEGPSTRGGADDVPDAALVATSHLAEAFLYLPAEVPVADAALRRAGEWLLREWTRPRAASDVAAEFCPLTHAGCVIRHLMR